MGREAGVGQAFPFKSCRYIMNPQNTLLFQAYILVAAIIKIIIHDAILRVGHVSMTVQYLENAQIFC